MSGETRKFAEGASALIANACADAIERAALLPSIDTMSPSEALRWVAQILRETYGDVPADFVVPLTD